LRSLPSLNALRAFEAAARHCSFSQASQELHVTAAAVSHQVKALEIHLGVELFRRLPRALHLTAEGERLLPALRDSFDRLSRATEDIRLRGARGRLSISAVTTFALSWLVRHLSDFTERHPGIEVDLVATIQMTDFSRDDVDVAIRYGRGRWEGTRQDKLIDDVATPLCGMRWKSHLATPRDLAETPLLDIKGHGIWRTWLDAAGLASLPFSPAQVFDSSRVAIEAAMAGAGIAVGNPALHLDMLEERRLVQPFDLAVPSGDSYWLVCPAVSSELPKISAFREWLLSETRELRAD
jgi:DNA-binding transcriptional LysR family regulator